ncbi:MAG: O-antigen ligase family protein [Planctomycetales bacterium]|nr:O-antigen ligase family protein [Planctomycetales bacterium]
MYILTQTVRWLLILVLVATPWFFGGVWASVQWLLMFVAALLLGLDLVTRFGDDDRPNLVPSAWLPILFGIALGLFQLVPLAPSWAETFAPASLKWRQELTADANMDTADTADAGQTVSERETPTHVTRSMYPAATREYLALLTLAMAVFVLASVHLVDRQSVVWFFVALGVCGAALSFFGLVQRLSWNGKFYWIFEPINGGVQSFGPFVNRNNAGGFLNLCLAAGIGWLVWLHRNQSWTTGDDGQTPERRRTSRGSSQRRYRQDSGESRSSRRTTSRPQSPDRDPPTDTTTDEATPATKDDEIEVSPTGEQQAAPVEDLMQAYRRSRESAPSTPASDDESPEIVPADLSTAYTAHRAPSQGEGRADDRSDESRRSAREGHRSRSSSNSERSRRSQTRYAMAANPMSYGRGQRHGSIFERIKGMGAGYFGDFDAPRLGSLAIVGCIAGGVLCTASRGSIIAMFAAALITAMVLAMRRGNRGYAAGMLVMLVAGVGLMSWSGQTEFVQSRFQELFENEKAYESGRLPNWQEALQAWPDFRYAGSGLGTYRLVYERFQNRYVPATTHMHAENQFVQSLVEGGVAAFSLLLLEILLTTLAIVRLYRTGGPVNNALAIAGTFGLTSQFIGGMFDFGLYIPSNAMLMAAMCGIVIGRAALLSVWPAESLDAIDSSTSTASGYQAPSMRASRQALSPALHDDTQTLAGEAKSRRVTKSRRSPMQVTRSSLLGLGAPTSVVTLLIGFLLLGCLFGSLEMNKASRIQAAERNAGLEQLSLESRPEVLAAKAAPLQTALPLRWDDAEAHRQLAELLVQQYRAATYHDLLIQQPPEVLAELQAQLEKANEAQSESGKDSPPPLIADLWLRSSAHHLFGVIHRLQQENQTSDIESLRQGTHVEQYLVPAGRHLLLAREIAPTIPQVHYLLAELSAVLPELGSDQIHLERTHVLAPGDAELWYWSGVLDLGAGRTEQACSDWNTSLLLSPSYANNIVESVRGKLTLRQLFADVLPKQADLLLFVIQRNFAQPEMEAVRKRLLQFAEDALPSTKLPDAEYAYVAARIFNMQEKFDSAIPHYEKAIAAKPTSLGWRYEYAQMLLKAKKYEAAIEQATYLARVAPENKSYENLLRQAISDNNRKDLPTINK